MTNQKTENTSGAPGPRQGRVLRGSDLILPKIVFDEQGKTGDGVTHINVNAECETILGHMLAPITHMPFVHPTYGSFQNLQGFWEWIKSAERPDALRYMSGKAAVSVGRDLTKIRVNNFHDIVMEANYCRIDQNERLREEFIASTLPFDVYYIKNPDDAEPLAIRPASREILVSCFTQLRDMMREGRVPPGFEDYRRPLASR